MNTNNTNTNTNTINNTMDCQVVQEMQRSFPNEWHFRIANTPFDTQPAQKLRENFYKKLQEQEEERIHSFEQMKEPDFLSEEADEDDDYDEDMERILARECLKRRLAAEARKQRPKCQRCNVSMETNNSGVSCVPCIFALKSYII